jgi:hypothetical protein
MVFTATFTAEDAIAMKREAMRDWSAEKWDVDFQTKRRALITKFNTWYFSGKSADLMTPEDWADLGESTIMESINLYQIMKVVRHRGPRDWRHRHLPATPCPRRRGDQQLRVQLARADVLLHGHG